MKDDLTLTLIFKEVQAEIKEEEDEDISIQELSVILESEFQAVLIGVNHGVGTRLPVFGSFYNNKSTNGIRASKLKAIKDQLTEEEYKVRVREAKIRNKAEAVERSKLRRKPLTLEQLLTFAFRPVMNTKLNTIIAKLRNER